MPTSPNPHSRNRVDDAIPFPAEYGADSSTFCSTMSTSRTTDRPNPDDRPNGKCFAPDDAVSAAAIKSYSVDIGHRDHHQPPPTPPYPIIQSVLPKVEFKSRVWSLQVLS